MSVGDYENLEDLRAQLRQSLQEQAERAAENEYEEELWAKLLEEAAALAGRSDIVLACPPTFTERLRLNRAATAAADFTEFLRGYVDRRRTAPADDLITQLIAAGGAAGRSLE